MEPAVKLEPMELAAMPRVRVKVERPVTPPRKTLTRGRGSLDCPFTLDDSPVSVKRPTPRRSHLRPSLSPESLIIKRSGGERRTANSLRARSSTKEHSPESELSPPPEMNAPEWSPSLGSTSSVSTGLLQALDSTSINKGKGKGGQPVRRSARALSKARD